MSEWAARRFWQASHLQAAPADLCAKAPGIGEGAGGWQILLDDKLLRTPGKLPLILPTEALARAISEEWDAQDEVIAPQTMPLTRAANSAIERVAPQFHGVATMLGEYGGTDLLCYRADQPADLARRQAECWDPLIDWAARDLRAPMRITQGVIPVAQDPTMLLRLNAEIATLDIWGLTALHDLVTLPGSLILGLAVLRGRLDAEAAFELSRIDEEYQAEQWGRDDEADTAAQARLAAMHVAARFWALSRV